VGKPAVPGFGVGLADEGFNCATISSKVGEWGLFLMSLGFVLGLLGSSSLGARDRASFVTRKDLKTIEFDRSFSKLVWGRMTSGSWNVYGSEEFWVVSMSMPMSSRALAYSTGRLLTRIGSILLGMMPDYKWLLWLLWLFFNCLRSGRGSEGWTCCVFFWTHKREYHMIGVVDCCTCNFETLKCTYAKSSLKPLFFRFFYFCVSTFVPTSSSKPSSKCRILRETSGLGNV